MRDLELRLVRRFLQDHPLEAARALEATTAEERAALLADEPPEAAAAVLRRLSPAAASEALQAMELRSATALICRLPVGSAAQRLMRLALSTQEAMLHAVPETWRAPLAEALRFSRAGVGALMERQPPALPHDITAAEAVQELQRRPAQLAFDVFVVDRAGKLVGRTTLAEVHKAPGSQSLAGLLHPNPERLSLRASAATLLQDALWRRHDTLPVTDEGGLLVGALSHRRLRAAAGEERSPTGMASPAVEATELVWSGYIAALDVLAALTTRIRTDGAGESELVNDAS